MTDFLYLASSFLPDFMAPSLSGSPEWAIHLVDATRHQWQAQFSLSGIGRGRSVRRFLEAERNLQLTLSRERECHFLWFEQLSVIV